MKLNSRQAAKGILRVWTNLCNIKLALVVCVGRGRAWWISSDADALVVNQTLELEKVIDVAYEVTLAYVWLILNTITIRLQCSPWKLRSLERVLQAERVYTARGRRPDRE